VIIRTDTLESIRPLTDDERRAAWAMRYYALGAHRLAQRLDSEPDPPEKEAPQ
jgi:hypothetical protein